MLILREDERWSPCLDRDIFQFTGSPGEFNKDTWFHSTDWSGKSAVFGNTSVVLKYLTFLKRK